MPGLEELELDSRTRETLCRPDLLQAREAHFRSLDSLHAGEGRDTVFVEKGTMGQADCDPAVEPLKWLEEVLEYLADHADGLADPHIFRPLCLQYEPCGIHTMDALLGAEVRCSSGTWWTKPLAAPVGRLEPPDYERDETWVLLGSTHYVSEKDKPTNCLYVISDQGRIIDRYDKCKCVPGDLKVYSPGKAA